MRKLWLGTLGVFTIFTMLTFALVEMFDESAQFIEEQGIFAAPIEESVVEVEEFQLFRDSKRRSIHTCSIIHSN